MAYTQRAFTFHFNEVQDKLSSYSNSDGNLNLPKLQKMVQTWVSSTSNNTALAFMRFDEE